MKAFLSAFFLLITSVSFSQNDWFRQTSEITSNLRSIYFVDENNGWAAGDSGKILHTTNGGNNWNAQFSNTTISLSGIIFTDANSGIAVGSYNDGNPWCQYTVIILSTTNGGFGWSILQNGYGGKVTDLSKINNNLYSSFSGRDFQCLGTLGSIGKTTNNGINWLNFNNTIGGYAYTSVCFIDTLTGWATGEYLSDILPGLKK